MKIIVVLVFSVLAFALVLSCKSESGPDGDWKFVANIADENEKPVAVYMDLKSIEINDDIRKVLDTLRRPKAREYRRNVHTADRLLGSRLFRQDSLSYR